MVALTAFFAGAVLMALELLGSRILAPTLGSSIFVWGSLIGVVLAALSAGYALGGAAADRWPSRAGPALVLVDAEELKRFGELRLRLSVNGEVRQDMVIEGDILYPPVQALQALAKFQHLDAGDIVLTGTPVGTALTTHGIAPKGDIDVLAYIGGGGGLTIM